MNREITDYATTQMKGTIEEAGGGDKATSGGYAGQPL